MKINGKYTFNVPADEVWDLLLDPQVLLKIIPGLQKVEIVGDQILATATIGVGPVKGVFNGKLSMLEQQKPTHVKIVGEGKGGPGFLKGACIIDAVEANRTTTLNYQADVQLGGTLATVGQRLVDAATNSVMQQGFRAFENVLEERRAAEAASEAERLAAEAAIRARGAFPLWFVWLLSLGLVAASLYVFLMKLLTQ